MSEPEVLDFSPDNVARMVMIVFGTMSNGGPFWCFVAVKPSRIDELKAKVANKTLDLRTYEADGFGEIVVSGESVFPPDEVIKDIAAVFNVPIRQLFADININDEINKAVERVKKEYGGA